MKKEFRILILALTFGALLAGLAGCKQDSPEEEARTVDVYLICLEGCWVENGKKIQSKVIKVPYGEAFSEYAPMWKPYLLHNKHMGWYELVDGDLSEFSFNEYEPLYSSVYLYAKWNPVVNGHDVTFIMEGEDMGPPVTIDPGYPAESGLPKLSRNCDVCWYSDANYTIEFDISKEEITKDCTIYGFWADYAGSWAGFIDFLNSKDDAWFEDETRVRGFIIKDSEATNTAGLATISQKVDELKIYYLPVEYNSEDFHTDWDDLSDVRNDTDFDHAIRELKTGKKIEQKLSILSKLKCKTVLFNFRMMPNLNEFSDNCFTGFTSLYKLYLPLSSSIKRIGKEAFLDCNNLCEFKIPSSVNDIGQAAFKNCYSIANEISIPDGVTEIAEQAFRNCKSIPKLNLTGNVYRICQLAFMGCEGLSQIIIPEGVRRVNNGSFACCGHLDYLEIPCSVENSEDSWTPEERGVGEYAFWKCSCDNKVYNDSFLLAWENKYLAPRWHGLIPLDDQFLAGGKGKFRSRLLFSEWKFGTTHYGPDI
ncbi:hypothetical protein MSI_05600 [Treponema sp. JC4]|uniref:leucine-rich repeat domain-containing protein n=1 Tax=Treponema sp. JC4 TaxID=1124982 RepID=UPI00025B0A25|nr:leucine-rich repeat domain-containing protein [Treponema sp. JC4]EID85741.1 hypothetical protein MSI_05600 [Treponema sp. JC4]